MRTKTAENITNYIQKQGGVTAKSLAGHFGISRQALFKHLARLLAEGKIYKLGSAPKVVYKIKLPDSVQEAGPVYGENGLAIGGDIKSGLPSFLKPFFWSYKFDDLDLQTNKKRIITNILNYGDRPATDWVENTYEQNEIKQVLLHPLPGEWSKRSYNFWSLVYGTAAPLSPRTLTF